MKKSYQFKWNVSFIILFLISTFCHSQTDSPTEITATGNQSFCPGNPINIVENFTITDADDTGIEFLFIQIATGYQNGFDVLELTGNHPNIKESWNSTEGKLTLSSNIIGSEMLFSDIENAVKNIVFKTTSNNIVSKKIFSITLNNTNYLPETDHFYEFVEELGITWKNAKVAAENRTYFGRQGYLATLTSEIEADFAGKQASGTGWIGGSDEETEGVWKWVTGPEAGTIFWRGQISGTTPNFAFWNRNEPNDFKGNNPVGEDYAHITDPNIPNVIVGSWNDLPNTGGTGLYVAKGYIVEYGKPGDPPLKIAASTTIYTPELKNITEGTICESGTTTISASSDEGDVLWFDEENGGNLVFTGTNFTTPNLNNNKTYYATVSVNGCLTNIRKAINVTVNKAPTILNFTEDLICTGSAILIATPSSGEIFWYDSLTSTTPIARGNTFKTPVLSTTTSFFAEANNQGCNSARTEVKANVDNTIPEFELVKSNYFLCNNIGNVLLETKNPLDSYRYVWTKNGANIINENPTISVSEIGTYTVKAISLAGCESLPETIIVTNSEKAILNNDDVVIVDDSKNNSIKVNNANLGIGNYEFSLDNEFGLYQEDSFFENLSPGTHILYIRDKNSCGTFTFEFSILAYPKYFTPNNDGKNDLWEIKGLESNAFMNSDIYIYNRFGVLLYKIDAVNNSWDGKYKGKKLPANTYWFKAFLTDKNGRKIEKTGNFSLITN